jgi:predicted phosphodiesterase
MRIFALSDLHADYADNARWIANLSTWDYRGDTLILAGDLADRLSLLGWCLSTLRSRFSNVLFVPGNHDLWVIREKTIPTSLQKFHEVARIVESSGASMRALHVGALSIVPVLGWYDYSFGEPSAELRSIWMDYHACRWPQGLDAKDIAEHFMALGTHDHAGNGNKILTFSHFVPRIDLIHPFRPRYRGLLDPILGSVRIEQRLRQLGATLHVYGHSHINRSITIDGVSYVNNAFGYPSETGITAKRLLCIHEC